MKNKDKEPSIKSDILFRVRVLYLIFFLTGVCILLRLLWVQFGSAEVRKQAERVKTSSERTETIHAFKGNILSRDGDPFARSIFRYSIEFDFAAEGFERKTFASEADSLSKLLSSFFGDRSAAEYKRAIMNARSTHFHKEFVKNDIVLRSRNPLKRLVNRFNYREYDTIARYRITKADHRPVKIFPRDVDYNEWTVLRTYPILNGSLGLVYKANRYEERVYPYGSLARRTIGLNDDRGHYGIENVYEKELSGSDGKRKILVMSRNLKRVLDDMVPVQDGLDVVTTIDADIQDVAHRLLKQQIESQHAMWGTSVVMEVATGDILAIVNLKNEDGTASESGENYALRYSLEPGSTFKLANFLTLVEEADMPVTQIYYTGHKTVEKVGSKKVVDSHDAGGDIDMMKALAESANVYFAKAVYETYNESPMRYINFLRRNLHLDDAVGLERFSPAKPKVYGIPDKKEDVRAYIEYTLPSMGYGYNVALTPMQSLTLLNAVANGGCMVAPRLVSELRRGGKTVERYPVEVVDPKICSDHTLKLARKALEGVVNEGTAKTVFRDVKLFGAAAKTGTADYVHNGPQFAGHHLGSMMMYFPSDNPRYSIITAIYTRAANHFGASLAGPVCRGIAQYMYNRDHDWLGTSADSLDVKTACMPKRVKGGDIASVRRVADGLSGGTEYDSRRGWGRAHVDSTGRVVISDLTADERTVPDVRGMGLKDALFLLENRGLQVRATGRGRVVSQSISPGARAVRGNEIRLVLK